MAISGKSGRVYKEHLIIEDCEDTWDEADPVAGVTISTTTGKVGNAARATTVGVGATTLLMSEVISKDLTGADAVTFWIRSSVSTSAADLRLYLDDTAVSVSPLEDLQIPALTANTWKLCSLRLSDPSLLGSLISVGLYQQVDLADGTFDIDEVYAVEEVEGINTWSISFDQSTVAVTDFQDEGVTAKISTISEWSGSFSGFKDAAPLTIGGSSIYVSFAEDKASDLKTFNGKVILTNLSDETAFDGAVSYSYTFEGTGLLEFPTA